MGIGQLDWLHLNGRTILSKERIKTVLRSTVGRTRGRADESINPLTVGRTDHNWSEVFRKYTVQRRA